MTGSRGIAHARHCVSSHRAGGRCARAAGFTLIEVLLATVLLAAALALAFATLRAATATAQRGEAIAQRSERMRAVELFLRRRIGGTRPVGFGMDEANGVPLRFVGEPDRLRFVADLPDYLGRGGPYLHDLTVVDADGGRELRVAFSLVMAGETFEDPEPRPPEVLATRLQSARFRYRTLTREGAVGEWLDSWETADRLPLQVEVTLQELDGRQWPPMVVYLPLAGSVIGAQP